MLSYKQVQLVEYSNGGDKAKWSHPERIILVNPYIALTVWLALSTYFA